MFIDRGGDFIKGDVRIDSSLKSGITTTITGSLGIDEVALDWFVISLLFLSAQKKRHSRKSGVD